MARRAAILSALAGLAILAAGSTFAPAVLAGGGCHGGAPAGPNDQTTTSITLAGCAFAPLVARVAEGNVVTFLNEDAAPHNVTGTGWQSPILETGDRFTHTFAAPGIYPFACSLHPGMNGAVVVGAAAAPPAASAPAQPLEPGPAPAAPAAAQPADGLTLATVALTAGIAGLFAGIAGWTLARARSYSPSAS